MLDLQTLSYMLKGIDSWEKLPNQLRRITKLLEAAKTTERKATGKRTNSVPRRFSIRCKLQNSSVQKK